MNILITGANGFIGQKVSKFFAEKKINVYGIGRIKNIQTIQKIAETVSKIFVSSKKFPKKKGLVNLQSLINLL